MTVVAYANEMMACDSAWGDGNNTLLTLANKITRLSSGGLFGSAGDDDDRAVVDMIDKVKTPAGLPTRKQLLELQYDFHGILVLPKGRVYHLECSWSKEDSRWSAGLFEVKEGYYAIGSGRDCAFTALECGKNAREACYMACRRTLNCRPPIHVELLHPKPALKKPKPDGRRRNRK